MLSPSFNNAGPQSLTSAGPDAAFTQISGLQAKVFGFRSVFSHPNKSRFVGVPSRALFHLTLCAPVIAQSIATLLGRVVDANGPSRGVGALLTARNTRKT